MAQHYTLHHLLLSCVLTSILVSLLVTALHSQWRWQGLGDGVPGVQLRSAGSGGGGAGAAGMSSYPMQQLSADLARSRDSSPTSSLSPLQQQCPACPACGPGSESGSAGGSDAVNAYFDRYIALHKSILAGEPGVQKKYVVARPQAQMNNRLRVIVSGIALGMLTNRAFLVEFSEGYYASLSDVFDPPISMDLRSFRGSIQSHDALQMEDLDTILCTDFNARFTGDSIDLGTPPNLLPFFWRNPFHSSVLRAVFGEGPAAEESMYRLIALRFLKPSAIVSQARDSFAAEHFRKEGVHSIGIHLRWGGDFRPQPVRPDEWEDMAGCVNAVVPSHLLQRSESAGAGKLVLFVAADTPESREQAQRTLTEKFPRAKIVFFQSWLRSNTPGGVQAALTELLLLAACDTLVLTPGSSYGEQAQALRGKAGYFVRSTVPEPARIQFSLTYEVAKNCVRPFSTQPTVEFFSDTIKRAKCYHPDMHGISF